MTTTIDQTPEELKADCEAFRRDFSALREEVSKVIVGQTELLDFALAALLVGGHVLLESVPGLGKTMLVRSLAEAMRLQFHRVQFTPDLMPADLIGAHILAEGSDGRRTFEFQRGPVFANVLLADEINRATPKTQSALLEAMAERRVTTGGVTHPLPEPFFVLATQNPLEQEGTYPLPEAQLDRFCFKLLLQFPSAEELDAIILRTTELQEPKINAVVDAERMLAMAKLARRIPVAQTVRQYAVQILLGTHPEQKTSPASIRRYVRYGASPRGLQAIILTAKILAILDSRYHVAKEDIRAASKPALRHRMILNFEGQAEGITADQMIDDVIRAQDGSRTSVVLPKSMMPGARDPQASIGDQATLTLPPAFSSAKAAASDPSGPTVEYNPK